MNERSIGGWHSLADGSEKFITLNALRVTQRAGAPLYVFGIDGRLIKQITTIDYATRTKDGVLHGYQRGAVKRHIQEIFDYLSTKEALLPNSIVVALDHRVKFQALPGAINSEWGTLGQLAIPLPQSGADKRAAWIIGGQQRVTALARLDPKKLFPVVVVGVQTESDKVQREQFVRVNKTKALPRDLVNELLPDIETVLPRDLDKRRVATKVLELARYDKASPFFGRIRGLGAADEGANISQAAVLTVIQNSVRKKGVLYNFFDGINNRHDHKAMAKVLSVYFNGVRRTWPEAWAGNPTSSKLVHGVGIVSLGHLMDRVMLEVNVGSPRAAAAVAHRLERLKKRCAWTSGKWPVLGCSWNELQNTSQDKTRLTDLLIKLYEKG